MCTDAVRYVGSLIPSVQDRLLGLRAQLKFYAEEYASVFGLYIGDENIAGNLAAFQKWREGSAYIHRWRDGVSICTVLLQPPLIMFFNRSYSYHISTKPSWS